MNLSTLCNKTILAACAIAVVSASAAFSTTITVGGTPSSSSGETTSVAGAVVTTFDNSLVPSNYTLTGDASIVTGNLNSVYKAPVGDSTPYLTTGTGTVTINFTSAPIDYFGFYWSSVDTYNAVALTNTLGQTSNYTGSTLAPLGIATNGTQSAYVNFFASPGQEWKSVTLSSTANAFELDNVATATPEPASLSLLGLGIGLAGFGAVRRRKAQSQSAA